MLIQPILLLDGTRHQAHHHPEEFARRSLPAGLDGEVIDLHITDTAIESVLTRRVLMALSDKDHDTFIGLQNGHISDAMEGMG